MKDGKLLFEAKGNSLPEFLVAAYKHAGFNYPKFYKMDNLSRLGWLAAEWLLKNSFLPALYGPADTGIVLANASASLDTDIKYFESTREMASPALFVYTLPNIVTGEICIRHHFKGENAFFIFADFDAVFIQQYVSNLINSNILQSCICGWVEVLGDDYKAVLYLVEKSGTVPFTTENINKIYQSENG